MGLISCGDSEADNPPVKPHDKSFAAAKACHSGNQGQLGSDNLIAHAGGLYQGSTYTNSLEAMNHSYLLGFRLIGIDLLRTFDRNFFGAHDWTGWRKRTNYDGIEQTSTTKEFLQQPAKGGITPVYYAMIEQWLENHPDAVLVADKTRNYKFLSDNTLDHDRLLV